MPLNSRLSWGVTSGDVTGSMVGAEAGEPTSSLSVPLEPSQRGHSPRPEKELLSHRPARKEAVLSIITSENLGLGHQEHFSYFSLRLRTHIIILIDLHT